MAETHTARVSRGAHILDKEMPGWEKHIDLSALDLRICQKCILGQLYGDYFRGLDTLQRLNRISGGDDAPYGFDVVSSLEGRNSTRAYKALTVAWVRLILRRIAKRFKVNVS